MSVHLPVATSVSSWLDDPRSDGSLVCRGMRKTGSGAGTSIRLLREMAGLTLAQVAEDAGTSPSYLSRVETGDVIASSLYVGGVTDVIVRRMQERIA